MTVQSGNVMQMSARLEFDGTEDVMNVFQFRNDEVVGVDDQVMIDALITYLETLYTLINASLVTLMSYRDIRAANISSGEVFGTFPWPTLVNGLNAGAAMAPGVALLANFSTGVSRVTPRKYFGVFPTSTMAADGLFGAGVVAAVASVAAAMIGPLTASGISFTYGYRSPKTVDFEPVVAATVGDVPAYQRRRKQGRGV